MQSGRIEYISAFYISTALQQHSHHLHMAMYSSRYQRCVTVQIICSAAVIAAPEQPLHSVHVSGFSSVKQNSTDL